MKKCGVFLMCILLIISAVPAYAEGDGVPTQDFCETVLARMSSYDGASVAWDHINKSNVIKENQGAITLTWGAYTLASKKEGAALLQNVALEIKQYSVSETDSAFDSYSGIKKEDYFPIRAAIMISALEFDPLDLDLSGSAAHDDGLEKADAIYQKMIELLKSEYQQIQGDVDVPCYDGKQYRYFWRCSHPMYIPMMTDEYKITLVAELK